MARSSLIPGFRFHPTDVELVMYYLKKKLLGRKIIGNAVAEVNIYDFNPRDLPDKSSLRNGDLEWFFFCPKSKKYSSGSRLNRATEIGFWKATGKDRKVTYKGRTVATIKTLVFHLGHAGSGKRTDWVMHEYKMEDEQLANAGVVQDMYVICKVFEKSGPGPKNGAQYGAPFNEEEWDDDVANCSGSQAVVDPNTVDHKQKGPAATMNMTVPRITGSMCITKPGSSAVTYSANENTTNTLNNNCNKLKAPVMTVSVNKPGSSSLFFPLNERYVDVPPPVIEDMMLFEDLDSFLEPSPEDLLNGNNENQGVEVAKSVSPNKVDDGIYDELVNFINLDDFNGENFKTDGAAAVAVEYTFDEMLRTDDLAVAVDVEHTFDETLRTDDLDADLREFYVD